MRRLVGIRAGQVGGSENNKESTRNNLNEIYINGYIMKFSVG